MVKVTEQDAGDGCENAISPLHIIVLFRPHMVKHTSNIPVIASEIFASIASPDLFATSRADPNDPEPSTDFQCICKTIKEC